MTAAEFQQWRAYAELEPFGERRADRRAWLAAMASYNAAGMKPPANLVEILPDWQPPRDPSEVAASLLSWLESMKGSDGPGS